MSDRHDRRSEWSLVAFTTLLPGSVGITVVAAIWGHSSRMALLAAGAASLGLAASLAHLARPARAPLSITNWRTSWLSREILAASGFWAATVVWSLTVRSHPAGSLAVLSAVTLGGILLYAMAQLYDLPTRPAWKGPERLWELVAITLTVGVPAGVLASGAPPGAGVARTGVCAVAAGTALGFAAGLRRTQRLARMTQEPVALESLARLRELHPYSRLVLLSHCTALALSVAAAIGPRGAARWLWAGTLAASLAGATLSRVIFYAVGIQKPHLVRLGPPFPGRR